MRRLLENTSALTCYFHAVAAACQSSWLRLPSWLYVKFLSNVTRSRNRITFLPLRPPRHRTVRLLTQTDCVCRLQLRIWFAQAAPSYDFPLSCSRQKKRTKTFPLPILSPILSRSGPLFKHFPTQPLIICFMAITSVNSPLLQLTPPAPLFLLVGSERSPSLLLMSTKEKTPLMGCLANLAFYLRLR